MERGRALLNSEWVALMSIYSTAAPFGQYPEAAMQTEEQQTKPAFPTGQGQFDTRAEILSDGRSNPSLEAGQSYTTLTGAEIVKLAHEPPSLPKERGQWFIPSTYTAADARCHEAQRAHGTFRW